MAVAVAVAVAAAVTAAVAAVAAAVAAAAGGGRCGANKSSRARLVPPAPRAPAPTGRAAEDAACA